MTVHFLLPFLAFGTLLAVVIFGYVSAVATERRLREHRQKSTLAADAPSTLPPGQKPVDT